MTNQDTETQKMAGYLDEIADQIPEGVYLNLMNSLMRINRENEILRAKIAQTEAKKPLRARLDELAENTHYLAPEVLLR